MPDQITMTPERWARTREYIATIFAADDARAHAALMKRASAAGLPPIDVGPETGCLLRTLVRVAGGGIVVEVGTLGGSSAIWMAQGLVPEGRVITIDISPEHAAFARDEFAKWEFAQAGVADRIDARVGRGSEVLPTLLDELGAGTVDLVLLDADRSEYSALVPIVGRLLRPGGLMIVDNALSAKRWTADPVPDGEERDTMDELNRQVAKDRMFDAALVPVGNGLLLAARR